MHGEQLERNGEWAGSCTHARDLGQTVHHACRMACMSNPPCAGAGRPRLSAAGLGGSPASARVRASTAKKSSTAICARVARAAASAPASAPSSASGATAPGSAASACAAPRRSASCRDRQHLLRYFGKTNRVQFWQRRQRLRRAPPQRLLQKEMTSARGLAG